MVYVFNTYIKHNFWNNLAQQNTFTQNPQRRCKVQKIGRLSACSGAAVVTLGLLFCLTTHSRNGSNEKHCLRFNPLPTGARETNASGVGLNSREME